MEELVKIGASFGISGLFFIMWVMERKDRIAATDYVAQLENLEKGATIRENEFTKIVIANTEAITRNTVAMNELIRTVAHDKQGVKV